MIYENKMLHIEKVGELNFSQLHSFEDFSELFFIFCKVDDAISMLRKYYPFVHESMSIVCTLHLISYHMKSSKMLYVISSKCATWIGEEEKWMSDWSLYKC